MQLLRRTRLLSLLVMPALYSIAWGQKPSLSVGPYTGAVHAGTSFQLMVTTANISEPVITWSVNGVAGGDSTNGTISDSGLYVAPAAIPASNPVVVKATLKVSSDPASNQNISQTIYLTVVNPFPVITNVNPARVSPGVFTLQLSGSGFVSGLTAAYNGNTMSVTSLTPTSMILTGVADQTDIGTQTVIVTNPDPGAASSSPGSFVVSNTLTPQMSATEAARFLDYATFGPTRASVDELQSIGYQKWFTQQFAATPSIYPAAIDSQSLDYAAEQFYANALTGSDQLRQRMAFALHQIFVVSGVTVSNAASFLPYLRTLQADAFSNYRTVMEDIALNPAMGEFLNMVNNDKTDPATGASPNENFARELMQLFTIGLAQLNPDGTPQLDSTGSPIPTYSETDIGEFARVYTGWTYQPRAGGTTRGHNSANYSGPMVFFEGNHDEAAKTLLNGVVLPAGSDAKTDLEAALDNIFNHPNVGPFVSKNLIQHFVTSNPSPAYVQRVATVFNNPAARGDLKAVITAILTDPEAQNPPAAASGHLREPVLFVTSVMRALGGEIADHPFLEDSSQNMGQTLFYAPSVFNYFSPGYRILNGSMLAPEFQLLTQQSSIERVNYVGQLVYGYFGNDVALDLRRFMNAASDSGVLTDLVNSEIMHGTMSPEVRQAIMTAVDAQNGAQSRVRTALYLAASSSQYQVIH